MEEKLKQWGFEGYAAKFQAAADMFTTVWPKLYGGILDRVRKMRVKDKHLLKLAKVIEHDVDSQKAPVKSGGRKRQMWKPSIVESMQHFIDVKEPSLDLQSYLKSKSSQMMAKGLKMQPHVVVLSEDLENIGVRSAYYACVHHSVFYATASLLEAVDIVFKSAFVFGLQFPAAANSCWLFMQRTVYDISTKFDRVPSKVLELIIDLE